MDKAQILSTIKAKIGETDTRFDRTIFNFIERKKLTEVADADLNVDQYVDDLKWMRDQAFGLSNHEIAEAKKLWEQQHPTPAPTPQTPPTPPAQEGMSPEVKAMLEQQKQMIEALSNQMKANQQQASIDAIRASVISRGKELNANAALWEMAVKQTNIAEGATADSIEAIVKPAYEAMQKSVFGNNGTPYGSNETDQEKSVGNAIDAFFKSKGFGKE